MPFRPAVPAGTLRLDFRHHAHPETPAQPVRTDVSAVEQYGRTLWVASDETCSVERLIAQENGSWGGHQSFPLTDFLNLPEGAAGEADLEGLTVDDRYLWVVGSHSLKRKKPKPEEHDRPVALQRLTRVIAEPNRYLLARVPLAETADDIFTPVRDGGWDAEGGPAIPAKIKMRKGGSRLTEALHDDVHLARFLDIPSKENGFDIEGLAVCGEQVFLGLRGPVLRGWAVVLELALRPNRKGSLKLRPLGPAGQRYRKHFLDLGGLGIRELHRDGDDLLVLAGPTMDLSGPVRVFVWRDALAVEQQEIVPSKAVERVLDLPHGDGEDHAEGLCLVSDDGSSARRRLMVVYDSPAARRLHDDGRGVDVDLFELPKGRA